MTFTDSTSRRLTALRAFHVPRGAVAFKDITMKMATLDGRLDLRELEPLAAAKFDKRALTTRWPSMFVANTYAEFAQRLFDRLGIGSGGKRHQGTAAAGSHPGRPAGPDRRRAVQGNGPRAACHICCRRQCRQALRRPRRSYQEMQTAAEKQHTLARLPQLWAEREQARADEKLIDTFGAGRPGDTLEERCRTATWKASSPSSTAEPPQPAPTTAGGSCGC